MIFCVEDDAGIRDLMIYTLNASGFRAVGFENAREFYAALADDTPELIMLDIMLPGEDGISILKRLKADARTADIPVIMATAKGNEYDKVIGLDLGADDLAELSLHFHINSCIFDAVFSHSISFLSLNTLKGSTENSVLPFQSSGNP